MNKVCCPYRLINILLAIILLIPFYSCKNKDKLPQKVLIVTGGHAFDTINFYKMFDSFTEMEYKKASHPNVNQLYTTGEINNYDVIIYYDMNEEITEEQKTGFLNLLGKGKGLVFLHHSLGSYQNWPAYLNIVGGQYYFEDSIDNKTVVPSTYTHDTDISIIVEDKNHSITRGVKDFRIHGEVYNNITILPTIHPLLHTTHPESEKIIAWTNIYGNSRIVYIQSGHDNNSYSNIFYRTLVENSIKWVYSE